MKWQTTVEALAEKYLAERASKLFSLAPRDQLGRCRAIGLVEPAQQRPEAAPPAWLPIEQHEVWSLAHRAASMAPTDPYWQEIVTGIAVHPDWPWNYAVDVLRDWVNTIETDRTPMKERLDYRLDLVRRRGHERTRRAFSNLRLS